MKHASSIAIVGGGLAGLCAAHALRTFGIEAEVFEAASELGEIGAAVNIMANGTKSLEALGLGDKLAAAGDLHAGIFSRNMHSGELIEFFNPEPLRWGAPQYTLHRADLIGVLVDAVDPASIRLGHRLESLAERDDGVELSFTNGVTHRADFVIGADGVHSVMRHALYGDDNPAYTGQMVWRALLRSRDVPAAALEPNGNIQWLGPGRHFIAYYVRGGELVNVVTQEDTDEWVEEGWSTSGDPDEMRRSFPDPEPRLAEILRVIDACSKWGLFTRPLTENWGRGRIQLIGDAAHAMLPNAGQGACQAFEDAYILARWLATADDPRDAFSNFRRVRIPRVHGVQQFSIAAARFKHMHNPAEQKALLEGESVSIGYDSSWIRAFDPIAEWDRAPVVPVIEISE